LFDGVGASPAPDFTGSVRKRPAENFSVGWSNAPTAGLLAFH
jgi:hypothetical protein